MYPWLKSAAVIHISIHSYIKNIHGSNVYLTAGNFPQYEPMIRATEYANSCYRWFSNHLY